MRRDAAAMPVAQVHQLQREALVLGARLPPSEPAHGRLCLCAARAAVAHGGQALCSSAELAALGAGGALEVLRLVAEEA